jgi:hypothetical protein
VNTFVTVNSISFEVMLPSACSFIANGSLSYVLAVAVLHYMLWPIWPSSGVYDVLLLYS